MPLPITQLCTTLDRLEAERSSAEARADNVRRQLTAARAELAALQDELDRIKGQRDGLTAALTEWGEWRGDLARRMAQALEAQRAWFATVDPLVLLDSDAGPVSCTGSYLPAVSGTERVQATTRTDSAAENPVSVIVRLESMAVAGKLVCGGCWRARAVAGVGGRDGKALEGLLMPHVEL